MVKKVSKKKVTKKVDPKFEHEKKLLKMRFDHDMQVHKNRMEELHYIRETENYKHEKELERGRIKSAEIRKHQERKALERYHENKDRKY